MKRIESVNNPTVKGWKKLHTKKERDVSRSFLVEGFHLVEEALKKKEQILELIIEENTAIPRSWDISGLEVVYVTKQVMAAISDTETPQGAAAVVEHLAVSSPSNWQRLLIADAIQDPGNLGTMIRTADAAGMDGIFIGSGCVDIYNSKTVRSSQGSIFHLAHFKGEIVEHIDNFKANGISVYGTALQGGHPYQQVEPAEKFALIIGNEGKGIQPELLQQTDKNLYIPIYGKAESLNAGIAAGILLYHLRG
ncbi:RNA methyltransferase [Bacillus lacus]|uniref:RNA methyltransferase n=1 Tax=Metabacillus lacus TaxID=1983721 RepID=A0A7X2IXS8_9BACI|nr:RNA methyltransferase [Metabacillus lacus]